MSSIKHENNQFIKENNDIEKYLIRIIQRYFSVEDNLSRESIEAIIVESLTRFKQSSMGLKGFLFSLNNRTGNIVLNISDFGGEKSFSKNNAFNKKFGKNANTICEGNDKRLSNNRKPLSHVHTISNIKNLEPLLDFDKITKNFHVHNNKEVLDILQYTGLKTEIDLIVLEHLQDSLDNHAMNLTAYNKELDTIYQQQLETLNDCMAKLNNILQYIKESISHSVSWLSDSNAYTDSEMKNTKALFSKKIIQYISQAQTDRLVGSLNASQHIVSEGEIAIENNIINLYPIESIETINENDQEINGYTNIESSNIIEYNTMYTINKENNTEIKMFFKYNKDDIEYTVPLPFNFITEEGNHIVIQGIYAESGNIIVTSRILSTINVYANTNNLYDSNTLIVASSIAPNTYSNTTKLLKDNNCNLVLIDSEDKNDFVKQLLLDNKRYFIQGINFEMQGTDFTDNNNNTMTYFDWDDNQPTLTDIANYIYINENKKWSVVTNRYSDTMGYVLEYKIKNIKDYYYNPRIYYQVLESKEIVQ